MTRPSGIIALMATLVLAGCAAHTSPPQLPAGWRLPTAAETKDAWRSDDAERHLRATADFDGDGRVDQAVLLVNETTAYVGLFVLLARAEAKVDARELEVIDEPRFIEVMGVSAAPKGVQRVMCLDHDSSCGSDGKKPLWLDVPAIDLFKVGSASSIFYWDPKTRSFEERSTSD
ncbi:MAG: hypothetical protein ABIR79_21035 [Candidatus Binatia bacterium]